MLEQAVYGENERNQRFAHIGGALLTELSADGRWIATTGTDRSVKLWRSNGQLVHSLEHSAIAYDAAFSPDSQKLLTGSLDGRLRIWSTATGQVLTDIPAHQSGIWSVSWSPNGRFLASGSSDLTVKIWSERGQLQRTLRGHKSNVWATAFHPDGQRLLSAGIDGRIVIWSLTGQPLQTISTGTIAIWDAEFSPDGQTLASAHADKRVRLWRTDDGRLLQTWRGHQAAVISVSFSPNGQQLASSSADRTVRLWDTQTGSLLRIYPGHEATVRGLSFSSDGQTIASVSEDGFLRLWAAHNRFFQPLHDHPMVVWRVVYAPRSSPLYPQVASITASDVRLWQRNGRPTQPLTNLSDGDLYSLAIHPTQPQLVAGDANGNLIWVDVTRNRRQRIGVGQAPIHGTAFSPDDRHLAAVGDDLHLNLWRHDDRGRYVQLQRFPAHKARIWDVAFSPDGSYLATSSTDSTVKLWTWVDRDRGQLRPQPTQVLKGTGSGIWGLAIRPDGERIAAASRNQEVRIWNRQGQLLRQIAIQGNSGLTRIAWSPDGQTLAIAKNIVVTIDNGIDQALSGKGFRS